MSSLATTPRRRVGLTVSGAWLAAALAIVATLTLPFGRPGRPFLTIDPDLFALNVSGPYSWLLILMLAAIGAALVASLLRIPTANRGDLVTVLAAIALLSAVAWLMLTATPFGIGAVATLAALVMVLGNSLSEGGRVQGDAFIASSILFVSLFVLLFILYPLFTVLKSAVFVNGRFD
ncbi:MAG TPA: hypothetical protein VKZ43_05360, partial [Trueperaceae bacterium]|nr:hypothetical protein [Trueperaceae bacterium]